MSCVQEIFKPCKAGRLEDGSARSHTIDWGDKAELFAPIRLTARLTVGLSRATRADGERAAAFRSSSSPKEGKARVDTLRWRSSLAHATLLLLALLLALLLTLEARPQGPQDCPRGSRAGEGRRA